MHRGQSCGLGVAGGAGGARGESAFWKDECICAESVEEQEQVRDDGGSQRETEMREWDAWELGLAGLPGCGLEQLVRWWDCSSTRDGG